MLRQYVVKKDRNTTILLPYFLVLCSSVWGELVFEWGWLKKRYRLRFIFGIGE